MYAPFFCHLEASCCFSVFCRGHFAKSKMDDSVCHRTAGHGQKVRWSWWRVLEQRQYKNDSAEFRCMLILNLPPCFPHRIAEWKSAPNSKQTFIWSPSIRSYIILALVWNQIENILLENIAIVKGFYQSLCQICNAISVWFQMCHRLFLTRAVPLLVRIQSLALATPLHETLLYHIRKFIK